LIAVSSGLYLLAGGLVLLAGTNVAMAERTADVLRALFRLVPAVGDRYLAAAGRVDYARLSAAMIVGLASLAYLFAGAAGVGVFALASAIGMIPPRFGARRVHLMGVLMGPLIVG
jgi:TctA family transporter